MPFLKWFFHRVHWAAQHPEGNDDILHRTALQVNAIITLNCGLDYSLHHFSTLHHTAINTLHCVPKSEGSLGPAKRPRLTARKPNHKKRLVLALRFICHIFLPHQYQLQTTDLDRYLIPMTATCQFNIPFHPLAIVFESPALQFVSITPCSPGVRGAQCPCSAVDDSILSISIHGAEDAPDSLAWGNLDDPATAALLQEHLGGDGQDTGEGGGGGRGLAIYREKWVF